MGFFDSLRTALGNPSERRNAGRESRPEQARRLAESWGLDDPKAPPGPALDDPLAFDRTQWRKKLKRILEHLPASRAEWPLMMAEARSLGFDPEWIARMEMEEFALMIRRAVSNRVFTEAEHRQIDLARDLIGLSESEAEDLLHSIVAEAESFFGERVEGA